jgi:hypothetical protein
MKGGQVVVGCRKTRLLTTKAEEARGNQNERLIRAQLDRASSSSASLSELQRRLSTGNHGMGRLVLVRVVNAVVGPET